MTTLVADVVRHRKALTWGDEAAAASLDLGSAREYADRRLRSPELRDQLLDPACRFLGLTALEEISAVDFLALARNMGATGFFNHPEGMGFLTRELGRRVAPVETSARVTAVLEEGNVFLGLDAPPEEKSWLVLIPGNAEPELACVILDHNKASGRVPAGGGNALVTGPVRRHRDLARLQALTPASSRVRLAGDAVSTSNVEACVVSGERAAAEGVHAARR